MEDYIHHLPRIRSSHKPVKVPLNAFVIGHHEDHPTYFSVVGKLHSRGRGKVGCDSGSGKRLETLVLETEKEEKETAEQEA